MSNRPKHHRWLADPSIGVPSQPNPNVQRGLPSDQSRLDRTRLSCTHVHTTKEPLGISRSSAATDVYTWNRTCLHISPVSRGDHLDQSRHFSHFAGSVVLDVPGTGSTFAHQVGLCRAGVTPGPKDGRMRSNVPTWTRTAG